MELVCTMRSAFSIVLLWLLVLVPVDAQSRPDEVQALWNFKTILEGDDIRNSVIPYWLTWKETDENPCGWIGVICSANYTTSLLDFSDWGLTAVSTFAPISTLRDLRALTFQSNSISGPIPDDVGSLNQIFRLDLSDNFFVGKIPANISACRNLQYLSLEKNMITGTIPDLSNLVELNFLILSYNQLHGSLPSGFGEMSSLLTLDVSYNQLNGTIPFMLNTTNLITLMLDDNSFVGFQEPITINAPYLQHLSVSGNQLAGSIPSFLPGLPHLTNLNMSSNHLSGTIPSGLYHNQGMVFLLDLSQNQLSGSIPADLLDLPLPEYSSVIKLQHNLLTGSIRLPTNDNASAPAAIPSLCLDFGHNQLSGPVPLSLLYAASLSVESNLMSGDIVDALLRTQPSAPPYAGRKFLFGGNQFTGDLSRIANQWTNWTSISILDLGYNNLSCSPSESIPDPMGAILYSMPINLTSFFVQGNYFSGTSLPIAPVSQADDRPLQLAYLDLSSCELEGRIAGDVFFDSMRTPVLLSLNLSHNSVTGPVPPNITNLPHLQILDLSDNELSGPLPEIPLNSSLINPSFFEGNAGLCGYPLGLCPGHGAEVPWWVFVIISCGSLLIALGSCLMVTWRWRVYHKLHEQDADLIRTLLKREKVTLMSLRNLQKATNNFAPSEQIGEGGFGVVYKGKLHNGTQVAIKRSKTEGSEKDKEQFLNEVTILSQVNHRHLVKLMGCCMENKVALLVFEFIPNGTLEDHLRGKGADVYLSWKQRLNIAVQTADALNYLHTATTSPIFHRDVKSGNILLNVDLSAKVADFGISKLAPDGATHVSTAIQGTIGYMDPEYWITLQLTEKSDVYSFGVVLLELISAKPAIDHKRGGEERSLVTFAIPFIQKKNLEPLIDQNLLGTYSELNGCGKQSIMDVARLALRCLDMQSIARPSMNEVWKELQNVRFRFDGTLVSQEDLGRLKVDGREKPSPDLEEILLSPPSSLNRSDSVRQSDSGSPEFTYFSPLIHTL